MAAGGFLPRSAALTLLVLAASILSPAGARTFAAGAGPQPQAGCLVDARIIYASPNGPLTPTGGSRFANGAYLVPFNGRTERGKEASFAFATPDLFCGPYPRHPETVASSPVRDFGGVYAGLEPDRRTFVIVNSAGGSTYISERRGTRRYTAPSLFHRGCTAISMQRIGNSMSRLTISVTDGDGRIRTQTVRTASPSTWGPLVPTPFRSSFGSTAKSRRATAAWTGNPHDVNEIVMAWAYDSNNDGDRVIRWARNSDFRTNTGWTAARTLASIPGEDLSDPRVSRWHGQTRVYFMEHDPVSGQAAIDDVVSTDHGRTWSAVNRIPIPPEIMRSITDLTPVAVGKSKDKRNPIGVIGAFDPVRGLYELIAFVIAP